MAITVRMMLIVVLGAGSLACGGKELMTTDVLGGDAGSSDANAGDTGSAADSGSTTDAPEMPPISFMPCPISGVNAPLECGWINFPARRDVTGSKDMAIGLWRILSGDPNAAQVWLLNGGPGGPGSDFASLHQYFRQFSRPVDMYMLDHRGTGNSEYLDCPNAVRSARDQATFSAACSDEVYQQWGDDLFGFSSTESSKDLGALIDIFSTDETTVVIYGGSYGSYWAHRYLQIFPDQADAVITDGNCISSSCTFTHIDREKQEVVKAVLEECDGDETCNTHYPEEISTGLELYKLAVEKAKAGELCRELSQRQLNAILLALPFMEPNFIPPVLTRAVRCNESDQGAIDRLVQVMRRFGGSFSPLERPSEAAAISEDFDAEAYISELPHFVAGVVRQGRAANSQILYMQLSASELWPAETPSNDELATFVDPDYAELDQGNRFALKEMFDNWTHKTPRDEYVDALYTPGATPWHLVHGEYDFQTGLVDAEKTAEALGTTIHVEPGGGHGVVLASGCGFGLLEQLVLDPTQQPDVSCLDAQHSGFNISPMFVGFLFDTDDLWD